MCTSKLKKIRSTLYFSEQCMVASIHAGVSSFIRSNEIYLSHFSFLYVPDKIYLWLYEGGITPGVVFVLLFCSVYIVEFD